jgi:hypothetical protein
MQRLYCIHVESALDFLLKMRASANINFKYEAISSVDNSSDPRKEK